VRKPKIKLFWFCSIGSFLGRQKPNVLDWRGLGIVGNVLEMLRADFYIINFNY